MKQRLVFRVIVLEKLEEYSTLAMEWFEINEMKLNAKKCHLFISRNKFEQMWAKIRDQMVWEYRTVNPLSANTTKWPNTFKQFVGNTCRIA